MPCNAHKMGLTTLDIINETRRLLIMERTMLENLVLGNDMVVSSLILLLPCLSQSGYWKSQEGRKLSNKNWSGDPRLPYSLCCTEATPNTHKEVYQRRLSMELRLSILIRIFQPHSTVPSSPPCSTPETTWEAWTSSLC